MYIPLLSHSLRLLDTGYSVITVGYNKVPNVPWKKYQASQITKEELEKNYTISDDVYVRSDGSTGTVLKTNCVGLCTGFNGLEVIDVDLKVLPVLEERTAFWEEYLNFIKCSVIDFDDKFVIYQTASGGYHILYRCNNVGKNQKIATLKNTKEAIIETRGVGGYVVVYGKQVSKLGYNDIVHITDEDRDIIINCSRYYDYVRIVDPVEQKALKNPEYTESCTPWSDFNNKTSIFDIIGNDFEIVRQLSDKYIIRRNGATSDKSGFVYKDSNCMYLFSTGTIYPHEKLQTPASCYTYKNHNGDFYLASKDLYKQGFGTRFVKKFEKTQIDMPPKCEFPISVFPESIQNYMQACHSTLDASLDYMGSAFLWLIAVVIGNSHKVQVKRGWVSSANIWLSCVGHAGIGKTPSLRHIINPLRNLNILAIKKYIEQYKRYLEYESLDKKEKAKSEVIYEPKKLQFIVDDITIEALVELCGENPNGVGVFKDELAGYFKDMNKYRAGSDLEFWLSVWSNSSVSVNRKTSKNSYVESPVIPIIGGIQPSILRQFYTEENEANGFMDRLLIIFPDLEVQYYNSNEMEQSMIDWYDDFILMFKDRIDKSLVMNESGNVIPKILKFSRVASIEWERIFNKITDMQKSDNEAEYFKSMLPKQKDYIPRFAMLLSVIDSIDTGEDITEISKESILKAEKLSDYFINQAKKIKFDSIVENDGKKILKTVDSKTKKEQAIILRESNESLSYKKIAEMLGVSKSAVQKYFK